jgi:hypothetical protein
MNSGGAGGAAFGTGRVTSLNETVLEMEVRLNRTPPPALPVTLVLASTAPKVLRKCSGR